MTTEEKNWFERNQGLITFLGYLVTVIIMAIALYYVYTKSTETLSLTNNQIHYQKSRDSLNSIRDAKKEMEYNDRFRNEDSINRRQDSISLQKWGYLKKRIDVTQSQLNKINLKLSDLKENQFLAQDFVMDTVMNKPATIRYHLYNEGKTAAVVKKITVFLWNQENHIVINNTPVNKLTVQPAGYGNIAINLPADYDAKLKLYPVLLIQVFFEDTAIKGMQVNKIFLRFNQYNPVKVVQVDEKTQDAMLNYIEKFKRKNKIDYLDFSFDGSRSN